MKKFLLGLSFLALTTSYSFSQNSSLKAKDYSHLLGMEGFSDNALQLHFKLYQGYVNNSNTLMEKLSTLLNNSQEASLEFAEFKRRFMWEYDGARLHEEYFDNLGGKGSLSKEDPLYNALTTTFGSFDNWKKDFVATGAMRGIGWSVLVFDPHQGNLFNEWINEHDRGHLADGSPLLIMDVFEHAYLLDYGIDRKKYIEAFFNNINWDVVSKRYGEAIKRSKLTHSPL